jgi:hypothetical protein
MKKNFSVPVTIQILAFQPVGRPQLPNSMQHIREEAISHSASQEIPRLLCNLTIHYHVHKSPPLVPILSQMKPVHTFSPYIPQLHYNIVFPSIPT